MTTQTFRGNAWGLCAIALGAWETAAFTTKRVPTISATCWNAQERYRRPTQAVVLIWLAGLGAHLLRRATDS